MAKRRLDHLLAGVAVAAVLALTPSVDSAFAQSSEAAATPAPGSETAAPAQPAPAEAAPSSETPAVVAAPEPAAPAAASPTQETTGAVAYQTASANAADAAIADKLRELTAGKFDRILGGRKERAGIEAFYSERNFAPLWIANGAANERSKAAVAYLTHVDEHGLDPGDYATPEFRAGADADALAEAELKLTQSVLTFARHAQVGRVHYTRIASDILYEQERPEPADVLNKIAKAANAGEALDSFHPPHAGYRALKAKLAEARGTNDGGPARIPGGLTLKYSKDKKGNEVLMYDPRVPALRERLGVDGDPENKNYDKTLADAVAKFQKSNKLPPNGQFNAATLEAINGPRRDRDADVIIANMERWRWMPRELGKTYVMVNIPDYTLKIVHNGSTYWQTKIVVGKPSQATPIMSAEMKFITVNPTWNVPPSIIQNEYLPAHAAGSDGARADGSQDPAEPGRHGADLAAAGRPQCARPHPLQLPQQVPGLSARHPGQEPVRARQARLQPRLHARHGSADVRREAAVARAAEGRLHPGAAAQDVRRLRGQHQLPGQHPGPPHLSERLRR